MSIGSLPGNCQQNLPQEEGRAGEMMGKRPMEAGTAPTVGRCPSKGGEGGMRGQPGLSEWCRAAVGMHVSWEPGDRLLTPLKWLTYSVALTRPLLSLGLCHFLDQPSLPSFILARVASRRLSGPGGLSDPAARSGQLDHP